MLSVHQLNVFVTAAETLNFTQTAKRLHLTQSSVSQHIKALENQLGAPLFIRKGRAIEVSDAGDVLLPMAREIIKSSVYAAEQMELIKKEVHGHIIIGCNTAPGKYVLPILCARFHQEYPLVRITCQVLPQDQTVQRLAEGDIHFAFSNVGELEQGSAEFNLYLQEPLALIAPKGHPWLERDEIDPEDLYEGQYIMREPSSGTYRNTKHALNKLKIDIDQFDVLLELGASEGIALGVQQGLGVGFVSQMIINKICGDKVHPVTVRGLSIRQNIYFGRQTAQAATGAQVAFWNFINEIDRTILSQEAN